MDFFSYFSIPSVYEVCSAEYFTKELGVCAQYPSWQSCACPFKAGEVKLTDIDYPLPSLGDWASVIAVSNFKPNIINAFGESKLNILTV